jgi:RNA polymerase sigma-70 factor (ECF subfamily)
MKDRIRPASLARTPRENGREVFEKHVLTLRDELMRKAMRMAGNRADAEDLVQECLLKALCAADTIEDPARTRSWVHAIMHNTFATMCRRNARQPATAVEPSGMDAMESRAPASRADLAFDLDRAIAGLDEVFREAVLMCDVEGHSYEEAATSIGCPAGTLMSRLFRGRRRLRAVLN